MTNLERIKNMSAEELAAYFCKLTDCDHCYFYYTYGICYNEIKQWLEREVEERRQKKS